MIKNPKKNYSLKGKPLSTKIAFVVICILIFSLILGSFGGLIYLGKSCSPSFTTVSADGVGGEEETYFNSVVSLNVSGIDYYAGSLRTADNRECPFEYFLFYLPLTIRSSSRNGVTQDLWLVSSYFDENFNIITWEVPLLMLPTGTVFNYGCFAYDDGFVANVGLVIETVEANLTQESSGGFSDFSSCDFYFYPSEDDNAVLYLQLNDTYGGYILFHIYPYNRNDFTSLNSGGYLLSLSARYTYKILPFNRYALEREYDKGFEDGLGYSKAENAVAVSKAFDKGYEQGKARGIIEGAAEASNYTFASLLDAVFYAPVKAFVSIFNFDFLGVNVLGFVTTIITVIIAFGIIKFFL